MLTQDAVGIQLSGFYTKAVGLCVAVELVCSWGKESPEIPILPPCSFLIRQTMTEVES